MSIHILPQTTAGKTSAWLCVASISLVCTLFILIASGQRGGQTFFSNPLLAFTTIAIDLSIIAAFVMGLMGVLKYKERSVVVFLVIAIGLFAVYFTAGELMSTH